MCDREGLGRAQILGFQRVSAVNFKTIIYAFSHNMTSTRRFCDDVFPPGRSSLVNEPKYAVKDPDYKKAVAKCRKWLRPSSWTSRPQLFKENANPGDIEQNQLGDCWLLSAFSVVALHPGLLKKIFVQADSEKGIYKVRLFHEGKWKIVTVDDRIPCNPSGKPIFGHCSDPSETWVVILEKAIAKLMGSYECLDGGWMEEGIHMLTGGRCEKINLKDYSIANRTKGIPKERLWNKLLKYDNERILMGCSITPGKVREARNEKLGLVAGHAYGILDIYETKDQKHKLVKIRNPWGSYEWRGKWSDRSNAWSLKYKKELNQMSREDGIFWMCYQDFKKYFDEVIAVRIFNDKIMTSFQSCLPIPTKEEVSFPNTLWERAKVSGEWGDLNSGGMGVRGFVKNPRMKMTLSSKTRCFMILTRPILTQLSESRYYGYNISFTVHRAPDADYTILPKMVKSNNESLLVGPDFSRYVGIELVLAAGEYVVTPSTDYSNRKGHFVFEVFVSRGTVTLEPLENEESEVLSVVPPTPRNNNREILRTTKRDAPFEKEEGEKKTCFRTNFRALDKSHMEHHWETIENEVICGDDDDDGGNSKKRVAAKKEPKYNRFQSSYQMFFGSRGGSLF